jgi:hypothetical protein
LSPRHVPSFILSIDDIPVWYRTTSRAMLALLTDPLFFTVYY